MSGSKEWEAHCKARNENTQFLQKSDGFWPKSPTKQCDFSKWIAESPDLTYDPKQPHSQRMLTLKPGISRLDWKSIQIVRLLLDRLKRKKEHEDDDGLPYVSAGVHDCFIASTVVIRRGMFLPSDSLRVCDFENIMCNLQTSEESVNPTTRGLSVPVAINSIDVAPMPTVYKLHLPENKWVELQNPSFTTFPSIDHAPDITQTKRTFLGDNKYWYIQEKIDGSQTSFRVSHHKVRVYCGKSEKWFEKEPDQSLFRKMMTMIQLKEPLLHPHFTYHGETVQELRHSTITYERIPSNFFILYDIQDDRFANRWLTPKQMQDEADRIGLECVPVLYENKDEKVNPFEIGQQIIQDMEDGKLHSILGDHTVTEGLVIKHPAYVKPGTEHQSAMKFKMVCKEFKEKHKIKKPKAARHSWSEYVQWVGSLYDVPARLQKAKQHLLQRNGILNPTKQQLETELNEDLIKEREIEIKGYLVCGVQRFLKSMKAGKVTMKDIAENDSKTQRLYFLSHQFQLSAIVASFVPDVCTAACRKILQ